MAVVQQKAQPGPSQGSAITSQGGITTIAAQHQLQREPHQHDCAHAGELGLRTARFGYASSAEELSSAAAPLGWPVVVKPVMSSSGKGQSVATNPEELQQAWTAATQGARGNSSLVIVEEFLRFEQEITLLTVRQKDGPTLFCPPIGHIQERGDYQCSWQPAELQQSQLLEAQRMARQVTDALGGAGIFGVEFFIASGEVIFSELSPRPHDTGLVTLRGQNLSEFELHLRAVLGLPSPASPAQERPPAGWCWPAPTNGGTRSLPRGRRGLGCARERTTAVW